MSSFLKLMMKRKELIPLVTFLGLATGGAITMCAYSLITKSDVVINKTRNPTPWENIDSSKSQKLVTINQVWKPVEEVKILKSMMK